MTWREWLQQAIATLQGGESPRRDAEILLGHVTGKSRTQILAFDETTLSAAQAETLTQLLARRQNGEPIAHLVGSREFWSLPLFVSPATLIPRPDTECLVEQALARLPQRPCRILDLGTGTGAVALALASERPDCQLTAVDYIADAAALAQRNADHLGITNVTIMQSDWFSALSPQRFAMIVSNPPYIDEQDEHLSQGDVRFEPKTALVAGDSGLADLAHIVNQGRDWLEPGGYMLLEHGWRQGAAVRALFTSAGYAQVQTCRDYGDNDRLTLAQWPGAPEAQA
ncbi:MULTISPECIES: peptide chain release factor N(5)-glutamine methyltransferase [Enterobacteriaceae]|uniref:peptide chain release factor N(5)-glutamine methyltransferase n=1 Tax=Enterobacteriaceae TaxID=543 RepID=UPI0015DC8212|nr:MULTISPECIES: peptide chain release factor N(5)-glutamine methyltransferase [unclassified Klebsiella]HAT3953547.1 peptide chain release factor N(5)-glutamine methyltransferase [Kluyvera ascorbata]BBR59182.1 release factor glutamine methyltransferase [Klebsiella sp. WP4-W18-ESBL-05]BBS91465.1 release factor glutamine methyltransferase [Klebsiella sp. WP7-S18-CRE-02]BBS96487.1 release factor glutamine methyltransferase [Klebsiella sp. WP7-S18-CRE-03]BBT01519.1 release factor glutamine methylt